MYEASDTLEGSPTYSKGDIVWVKLSSYWWPGEVITEEDLPADLLSDFKKPPLVIVKFFDEDSYEYVRVWSSIHPYNCDNKSEFIKKGMAGFRSKLSHMAKFPKDIGTAEERTDGNPNILSQPEFLPVKKINYDEIFGSVSPKKPVKGKISLPSAKKTPGKDNNQPHITHRRFLGNDDYRAYICIQYPGKDRQWDSDDEEIKKLNEEPEKVLACHSCSFKTRRLEVMILHTKMHIQGIYITSKRKPKKAKEAEGTDSDSDAATTKSPKPKQRKKKEVKPQTTDVFSNLLDEWDDTDEEMEEPITTKKPKKKTMPVAEKKSSVGEKKEKQNDRTDDLEHKSTPLEASNNDTTAHTEPVKPESSVKNTYDDIKNCFDFDEEEEDDDILLPASVGRKIPRVIPEKPKPSIYELLEQSQKEDDLEEEEMVSSESVGGTEKAIESSKSAENGADSSQKEILRLSQSVNKAPDVDENIENTFKELMAETELPPLDNLAQNLKPEQNFHDARTVKFPDKGGTALKGDTTSTSTSKKRFITSFEDFEAGFRKLEDEKIIKQLGSDKKVKSTKTTSAAPTLLDRTEPTESKGDSQELKEVPSEAISPSETDTISATGKKSLRSKLRAAKNETTSNESAQIDIISTASVVEKNVRHTDTTASNVGRRKTRQIDKEAPTDSAMHQKVDLREHKEVISDKLDSKRKSSRTRSKQFVIEEDSEEIIEMTCDKAADSSEQIVGHLDEKTRKKLAAIDLEIETLKRDLESTQSTSKTDEVCEGILNKIPDNTTEEVIESPETVVKVYKEIESFEAENGHLPKETNKLAAKTDVPELEQVLKKSQRTTRLSLNTETAQKVDKKMKQLSEHAVPVSETPSKAKRKISQKSPLVSEQSDIIKDLAVQSFIEICDESEEPPIKERRGRSLRHQKNVEIDEREKEILTSMLDSDGTESVSMKSSLELPDGRSEVSISKEKVEVKVHHEKDTLLSICTEVSSDQNIELWHTQESTKAVVDSAPQESSDELKTIGEVIPEPIEPELTPRSKNSRNKKGTKEVPLDKIIPVEFPTEVKLSESIVVSSDLSSQKPVLPIEIQTAVPDLAPCSSVPEILEPPTPKSRRGRSQNYVKKELPAVDSIKTVPKDVPEPKQVLDDTTETNLGGQSEQHVVEIHEEPISRTRSSKSRKISENREQHSTVVEELVLKNLELDPKSAAQSSAEPQQDLHDIKQPHLIDQAAHHAVEVHEDSSPRTRRSTTQKSPKEQEHLTVVKEHVLKNLESEPNSSEQSLVEPEQAVTDSSTHLISQPAHQVVKVQEEPIPKIRRGRIRKSSMEQQRVTVVEEQVPTNLESEANVTEQSSAEPEQAVTDTKTHLMDHHVKVQVEPIPKTRRGRTRKLSMEQEQHATVVEEHTPTKLESETNVAEQSFSEPEEAVTDATMHLIEQPAHHVVKLQDEPISKTRSARTRKFSMEQEQHATVVEEQVLTNLESEANVAKQSSAEPEQAVTDTTMHLKEQHLVKVQEEPIPKTRRSRTRKLSMEQHATVVEEHTPTNLESEANVSEQSLAEPEEAVTDATTQLTKQSAHHVVKLQDEPISKTRSGRTRMVSMEQERVTVVEEQVLTNLESEANVAEQSSAGTEQAVTDTTTHVLEQHQVKVQEKPIPKTRRGRTRKLSVEQEQHATAVEEHVPTNLESEANVGEQSSAKPEEAVTDTTTHLTEQSALQVLKVQEESIPKFRRGRTRRFSMEQERVTIVEEQVLTNLESEANVAEQSSAEPEEAVTDITTHLIEQPAHHVVKLQEELSPKITRDRTRKLSMGQEQRVTVVEKQVLTNLESEANVAEHSSAEPEQAVTDTTMHLKDQHHVKVQEERIPKTRRGRTRKLSMEQEQHATVVEEHVLTNLESEANVAEQSSAEPEEAVTDTTTHLIEQSVHHVKLQDEPISKTRSGRARKFSMEQEQHATVVKEQVLTNLESAANAADQFSAEPEEAVTDATMHLIEQPAHHVVKLQDEPISKTRSGRTRKFSMEQEQHATVVKEQVLTNLESEANVAEQFSAEPEEHVTDTTTHLIDQHHVKVQEEPIPKTRRGRTRKLSMEQEQHATVVEEHVPTNLESEANVAEQSSAEPEEALTDTTTHLTEQSAHHVVKLQDEPISKTRSGRTQKISMEQERVTVVEEQVLTNLESEANVAEQSSAGPEQAVTDTTSHLIEQHHVNVPEESIPKTRRGRTRKLSMEQEQHATVVEEHVPTNLESEATVAEQFSAEPKEPATDTTTHLTEQSAHHGVKLQDEAISKTRSGRARKFSMEQEQDATVVEEHLLTNLESEPKPLEQSLTAIHGFDISSGSAPEILEELTLKPRRGRTRKDTKNREQDKSTIQETKDENSVVQTVIEQATTRFTDLEVEQPRENKNLVEASAEKQTIPDKNLRLDAEPDKVIMADVTVLEGECQDAESIISKPDINISVTKRRKSRSRTLTTEQVSNNSAEDMPEAAANDAVQEATEEPAVTNVSEVETVTQVDKTHNVESTDSDYLDKIIEQPKPRSRNSKKKKNNKDGRSFKETTRTKPARKKKELVGAVELSAFAMPEEQYSKTRRGRSRKLTKEEEDFARAIEESLKDIAQQQNRVEVIADQPNSETELKLSESNELIADPVLTDSFLQEPHSSSRKSKKGKSKKHSKSKEHVLPAPNEKNVFSDKERRNTISESDFSDIPEISDAKRRRSRTSRDQVSTLEENLSKDLVVAKKAIDDPPAVQEIENTAAKSDLDEKFELTPSAKRGRPRKQSKETQQNLSVLFEAPKSIQPTSTKQIAEPTDDIKVSENSPHVHINQSALLEPDISSSSVVQMPEQSTPKSKRGRTRKQAPQEDHIKEISKIPNEKQAEELSAALEFTKTVLELVEHQQTVLKTEVATEAAVQNESDGLTDITSNASQVEICEEPGSKARRGRSRKHMENEKVFEANIPEYTSTVKQSSEALEALKAQSVIVEAISSNSVVDIAHEQTSKTRKSKSRKNRTDQVTTDTDNTTDIVFSTKQDMEVAASDVAVPEAVELSTTALKSHIPLFEMPESIYPTTKTDGLTSTEDTSSTDIESSRNNFTESNLGQETTGDLSSTKVVEPSTNTGMSNSSKMTEAPLAKGRWGRTRKQIFEESTERTTEKSKPLNTEPDSAAHTASRAESIELDAHFSDPKVEETNRADVSSKSTVQKFMKDSMGSIIQKAIDQCVGTLDTIPKSGLSEWVGELLKISSSKEEGRLVTNTMEKMKSHDALDSTEIDASVGELPVQDSAHQIDKQQKLKESEVETLDPYDSKLMNKTKVQQLESDMGLELSLETKSNLIPTDIATEGSLENDGIQDITADESLTALKTDTLTQTNNWECIQADMDTSTRSDHKTKSSAKCKTSIDTLNLNIIDQLSVPETTKEIEEISTSQESIVEEHKELDKCKLNDEPSTSDPIDAKSSIINEKTVADSSMISEKLAEITPTCLEAQNNLKTTFVQLSDTVPNIVKSAALESASHEGSENLTASCERPEQTEKNVFPKERYKKMSDHKDMQEHQVTKLFEKCLDEAVGQKEPKSLKEFIPGSKMGKATIYSKQESTMFGESSILQTNQDETGSLNKATDIEIQSEEKSRQVPPKKNRWSRRETYAKNADDTESTNFLTEQIVQTAPDADVCEEIVIEEQVIEEQVVEINDDMKDTGTIISESEGVASQSEDKYLFENKDFLKTNKPENVSGILENSVGDLTDSELILPPKKSKRISEVTFNFLNDSFASTTLEKKADSDILSFPNCDDSIMSTSLRNNIEGLIKDIDSFDNGNMSDNLHITCKDDTEKVDVIKSDVNTYSLTDTSECIKESADISKCVPPKKKKIEYDVASASIINLPSKDTFRSEEKVADTIPQPPKKKIQKLFENSQALEKIGKLNDLPQMSPLAKKKSFLFQQEEFVKSQQVTELPQHIDVAVTKEAEKSIDTGEGLLETAVKPEELSTSDIKESEVSKSCVVPKKRKKRKSSCYEDHPQKKERRTSSDVDPSDGQKGKNVDNFSTVLDIPQSQDEKQVLDTTTTTSPANSVSGTPIDDNIGVVDDHKNEMEVSLKDDDFKFCIQTNLSNLATTAAAELSAIATATLSEIKNEVIVESSDTTTSVISKQNEQAQPESTRVKEGYVEPPTVKEDEIVAPSDPDMPESALLPNEPEFVPISLHPTVMSEKDLADAQVEITTDKVISEKKPTSLGMFSMDYLETSHIGKTISIKIKKSEVIGGTKKVNNTSGTEFTSKAMTKEFDNRALIAQPKAYALKSELLDILEGNSNSSTNSSGSEQKFKTSFDNYDKQTVVQGMFDFEEAIPSQIVLSNKVDPETVLMDSPKLLERLSMSSDAAKAKPKKVMIQSNIKVPESISKGLISKLTKPLGTPRPGQRILIKTTKAQAISSMPKASGNKPIILSEQIIRPANAIKVTKPAIQPQGIKRQYEDIEDVETAFIIPKMAKASVEEEVITASPEKPARARNLKIAGKAKILQQTIITPKGEIVQSQTPTSSKSTPSPLVQPAQTQPDDTVFDINSMPIVLSDDILTPECIQNMPVVLSEDVIPHSTPISVKVEEKVVPTLAKKIVSHVTPKQQIVFKTTPTGTTTPLQAKQMTKARILSNTPVSTIKAPKPCTTALLATGTSADGKQTKYVLVPSTVTPVVPQVKAVKPPVVKKQPVIQSKLATIQTSEPPSPIVGNKIMIVTNQHGQQTRVVLTPQQQKAFMQAQPGSKTKAIIKGAIPKALLESAAAGPSGVIQKVSLPSVAQVATTTVSSQGGLLMTVGKGVKAPLVHSKKPLPRTPAKPQKTILIKNQMGQTVRKIQGTDDADLDRQVAEQLEAIKASARLQQANKLPEIINYTNRAIASSTTSTKTAVRRSYAKKIDPVKVKPTVSVPQAQTQKPSEVYIPALAPLSPQPTISQVQSQMSPNLPKAPQSIKVDPTPSNPLSKALDAISQPTKHESKSTAAPSEGAEGKPTDRPLTQLVIQDGLGNQTTITEGQILAIPSETVDGQPQSYMLVTLDELGNITPLNNEALMSLDPSLGLGGDLNNMVLQVDQGQGTVAALRPAEPNVPEPAKVAERLHLEPSKIAQTVPEPKLAPVELPKPQEVPLAVEQQIVIGEGVLPGADAGGQQLIVTGDPIATQKFLESLSDGSTDLANILANAEGGSVLIQADGQQILIKTNTGSQSMLGISENTEGGGNPIFGAHKPNQDILAAALANTDVFQPSDQPAIHSSPIKGMQSSQLSPSGGSGVLYPMHVSNVLETSLTLSSPIMTPLEVPSLPNKKISDDVDILNQVPKNVDLPITITDPNISQTVAQQQAIGLMELTLPISETTVSSDINSPSYSYSLPALDEPVGHSQKPFNGSMPLLTEDVTEMENGGHPMGKIRLAKGLQSSESSFSSTFGSLPLLPETIESSREEVVKTSCFGEMGSLPMLTEEVMEDSGSSMGSSKPQRCSPKSIERDIVDEGLSTLGGEMCSSLSEPPPDMFDLASITAKEEEISSDMSSIPEPEGETLSLHSENSGEIPIQPPIVANLNDLKRSGDEAQGRDEKRQKFD